MLQPLSFPMAWPITFVLFVDCSRRLLTRYLHHNMSAFITVYPVTLFPWK